MRMPHPTACACHCGLAVDPPVLSGTPIPDLPGTRSPIYRERSLSPNLWHKRWNPPPSNNANKESFGFLLTRSPGSANRGQPDAGLTRLAKGSALSRRIAP